MLVAKQIDSFSMGLRAFIPCHSSQLPTIAPSSESGGRRCASGMLLGIFLFRSMDAFYFRRKKKKGAEEQLASGSRRGPRGPAAKANKEAT